MGIREREEENQKLKKVIEILSKNLTLEEIEKYDKRFLLNNTIYRNFIIKHIKEWKERGDKNDNNT